MFDGAKAVNIRQQRFWLLPEKAIYWQKRKTLLVADLHIGKAGHFRKNGIAVPGEVNISNLEKLSAILDKAAAEHLIILGDLFHSNMNNEWQQFISWRKQYSKLEVSLVAGNHDILEKQNYHSGIINLFKRMTLGPFLLLHDINELDDYKTNKYFLSGHIHPAVKLTGRGRQGLKLPCFYFGAVYGVLPAFGRFTGTHIIAPQSEDRVYIIADSKILSADKLNHGS